MVTDQFIIETAEKAYAIGGMGDALAAAFALSSSHLKDEAFDLCERLALSKIKENVIRGDDEADGYNLACHEVAEAIRKVRGNT